MICFKNNKKLSTRTSEESAATKILPSLEKISEAVKGTFDHFFDSQGTDYPALFQTF